MISTIADLLKGIIEKERAIIDAEDISHGPTIGDMYEGLAREILERAIPSTLDIRVVDGFVRGSDGRLSPQLDAMIVTGEGREVPRTGSYEWPIADVLAVIEVKKTLYGAELADAFGKLRTVRTMFNTYIEDEDPAIDLRGSLKSFAQLTGHFPDTVQEVDRLPVELSTMFHTITLDQAAPLRVIWGYHGYTDELGLRKGLLKFLKDQGGTMDGFGASSMPNLIVARSNSLLKLVGNPYISPLTDGWWHLLASNNENPLRLLIELLWSKFAERFGAAFPVDDNLQLERLIPFLDAKLERRGEKVGWLYKYNDHSAAILSDAKSSEWEPEALEVYELVVLSQIGRKGRLNIRDAAFQKYARDEGVDPEALIDALIKRRVIAWVDDEHVCAVQDGTVFIGFMPDGGSFATGESELLGSWLGKQLDGKKR